MDLPFDPIERAAAIWERRFGEARAMAAVYPKDDVIERVREFLGRDQEP